MTKQNYYYIMDLCQCYIYIALTQVVSFSIFQFQIQEKQQY